MGSSSTILRDVYLVDAIDEAADKQAEHPTCSFVTPAGVLVGPAVIHTAKEADARAREIRAELKVVEHDLAATTVALKPRRARLEEIAGESEFLGQQIEAADADITAAAERLARIETEMAALGRERELLSQRATVVDEQAVLSRDRLTEMDPETDPMPELPPSAQPPIHARVAVETLRRHRTVLDARAAELRGERDALAAHDPVKLRSAVETAERERALAETALADAEERSRGSEAARDGAAQAERAAAETESAVNRSWREASTELDRLRERYEDEDRQRGDIERRIREAERLLVEGHQRDPAAALAELAEDDTVVALEKRSELVQRRLALLGRVNLLATGEFEVVRDRHDFMQRELDDVRKARRDLLEVDREGRSGDPGDVRVRVPRRRRPVRTAGEGALPRR